MSSCFRYTWQKICANRLRYFTYRVVCRQNIKFSKCICNNTGYGHWKFDSNTRFGSQGILFAGIFTWLGFKEKKEEDPLITVMKRGILCLQREEYDKAENILHLALKVAQERQDMQAQRYIFDLLANVAYQKGDLPKAEKLFIEVTKELIDSGTSTDDNAIVDISLKLASIYSRQNETEKAEEGFKFCINTQQKKLNSLNLNDVDSLTELDKDTVLLWAMSMDWYARYLLAKGLFKSALANFKKALEISEKVNGPTHEQTLVLINDIGSVVSLQKDYDGAVAYFKKAIDRATISMTPDLPSFYCNLGATYLQKGDIKQASKACSTALKLAKDLKNTLAEEDAKECLQELQDTNKSSVA